MVPAHAALELRGMSAILRKPRVDRLDLFGPFSFSRVRTPLPAACVVLTCKRCLRARNALEQGAFCAACQRELDVWAARAR